LRGGGFAPRHLSRSIARGEKRGDYLATENEEIILGMKIYLTYAIAFAFLLQGAAFAQETVVSQPTEDNSPCPNFPMPVIEPFVDENKLPIVKPDSKIDFKLIIVNPCVSKTEQSPNSLFLVVPKNNGGSQSPATEFKFNGSGFTFTPKDNVTQNPFLVLKQP
jgi:hypothetical protein